MEQKFGKNSIDIESLREFCEREGKMVEYRKGEQLEREGDPARWFGFGEQLMDFFRQDAEKMEFLLRQASPFGMPSGTFRSKNEE